MSLPVGPMNMKLAMGRLGSESPARERCTASASSCHSLLLPDDPLVQLVVQVQQLLHLRLLQLRHGDARPTLPRSLICR